MDLINQIRERLIVCEEHLEAGETKLALMDVIVMLKAITDLSAMQVVPEERK